MKGSTCTSWCFCNLAFCAVVLLCLAAALLSDGVHLFTRLAGSVTTSASPLSLVAAVGATAGVWLGYRHHGFAQPLFRALLGLICVVVGHIASPIFALVGAMIVLGAAVWGALVYRTQQVRG